MVGFKLRPPELDTKSTPSPGPVKIARSEPAKTLWDEGTSRGDAAKAQRQVKKKKNKWPGWELNVGGFEF